VLRRSGERVVSNQQEIRDKDPAKLAVMFDSELELGPRELLLRVAKDPAPECRSNAVRIVNFVVNVSILVHKKTRHWIKSSNAFRFRW
jgi:hypothetical protein